MKGIDAITARSDGRVLITLRPTRGGSIELACSFGPLAEWLKEKPVGTVLERLRDRALDVRIQNGEVVSMQSVGPVKPQHEHHASVPRRKSRIVKRPLRRTPNPTKSTQATETAPPSSRGIRLGSYGTGPRGQGLRMCPHCHRMVRTTAQREEGRLVHRCARCRYPIAQSWEH